MQKWTRTWFVRFAFAVMAWGGLVAETPGVEAKAVQAFLAGTRVLGQRTKDHLTLVAVQGGALPAEPWDLATLDEVVPTGELLIKETSEQGTVNTLILTNNSKRAVFIMAGEILSGAKQDRILQQDILLPPRSKPLSVPAFCVERGRWEQKSAQFYSENITAPISVRQKATQSKRQGEVWSEVDKNNMKLQANASTSTLAATYKSGKVLEDRKGYQQALKGFLGDHPKATGVVVLINGKVVASDLFGSRRLLERLWSKLEASYIAEAVRRKGESATSPLNSTEELLRMAAATSCTWSKAVGMGKTLEMQGDAFKGTGIVLGAPVHVDLFPLDR